MDATFSTVIYDPTQKEIAKVNRQNKTLYLNPDIWKGLPDDQKEFVLLHEEGHLRLQTADEFAANQYAVGKFAPVRTLTNAQLAQRIIVMREILTPRSSFDPVSAIAGAVNGVMSSLSVLGVGSSARKSELAAQADAQVEIIDAQSDADAKKSTSTVIIAVLAGVMIIVIMTLYLTLKNDKETNTKSSGFSFLGIGEGKAATAKAAAAATEEAAKRETALTEAMTALAGYNAQREAAAAEAQLVAAKADAAAKVVNATSTNLYLIIGGIVLVLMGGLYFIIKARSK